MGLISRVSSRTYRQTFVFFFKIMAKRSASNNIDIQSDEETIETELVSNFSKSSENIMSMIDTVIDENRNEESDNKKTKMKTLESSPPPAKKPHLPPLQGESTKNDKSPIIEGQKIPMPKNRIKPLKDDWKKIYTMIVDQLKLQIRFNTRTNNVEIRKSNITTDLMAIQRASDFLRAFAMGFEIGDAEALIRIDELYLETFKVTDVKMLKGDHLARAIGRIAGTGGRNKHTTENTTKTRIVMADQTIHILGSFQNCRTARRAICAQIMGTPNSKIHGTLRGISERMNDRY